jgi:hypothetical protein
MKRCECWANCQDPIMYIHRKGFVCCTSCRKRWMRDRHFRRLASAERRLLHAGFRVTYQTRVSKVDAIKRLLTGAGR